MDTRMKLSCKICKAEVYVKPYISNVKIATLTNITFDRPERYTASMKCKAVCYNCGANIEQLFTEDIYTDDIVKLIIDKASN